MVLDEHLKNVSHLNLDVWHRVIQCVRLMDLSQHAVVRKPHTMHNVQVLIPEMQVGKESLPSDRRCIEIPCVPWMR